MINNKAGNNILQELVARHPGVRRTETRMSGIPTPGCQTAQDPGLIHHDTRVSYNIELH